MFDFYIPRVKKKDSKGIQKDFLEREWYEWIVYCELCFLD